MALNFFLFARNGFLEISVAAPVLHGRNSSPNVQSQSSRNVLRKIVSLIRSYQWKKGSIVDRPDGSVGPASQLGAELEKKKEWKAQRFESKNYVRCRRQMTRM